MNRTPLLPLSLALALATGAVLLPTAHADDPVSELVGQSVQDFTLPYLEGGKDFTFSSLKGKVVLMSFWASWCGPCRRELPAYNGLYAKYKEKGLEIMAISVDREAPDAKGFIGGLEEAPKFTLLLDAKSMVMGRYDIVSMPTSFVIGRDGKIVHREVGFSDEKLAGVEAIIQKALEAK